MAARPGNALESARLLRSEVAAGSIWHPIFQKRHPDPLGFGLSPSRFSDPRKNRATRFGVYYVGASFETAFLETIVRDRRNGRPDVLVLSSRDLVDFVHVPVIVQASLTLVDLRGGGCIAMGIPTDAIGATSHRIARRTSLALYRHPDGVDGICYPSRLNGADNLAIYDRAVTKLRAGPRRVLRECPELAPVLGFYRLALI